MRISAKPKKLVYGKIKLADGKPVKTRYVMMMGQLVSSKEKQDCNFVNLITILA